MLTVEMLVEIKIQVKDDKYIPLYQSSGASGADLVAAIEEEMVLRPGERLLVPTGISIEIPQGHEAQVRSRSGLALKHGIAVLNSPGTIDSDYRGEVGVILINHGDESFSIFPGMRIAQMVIAPVCRAHFLSASTFVITSRGQGGFGHTGE